MNMTSVHVTHKLHRNQTSEKPIAFFSTPQTEDSKSKRLASDSIGGDQNSKCEYFPLKEALVLYCST